MRTILIIIGILFLCLICLVGLVGLSFFFDIPAGLWDGIGYYDSDGSYYSDQYYYDNEYYYDEDGQGLGYDQGFDDYQDGLPDLPASVTGLNLGNYMETGCPFQTVSNRVTCGYLAVPEDHTNSSSPTIYLAVATIHASSANPGSIPLIYLEGGPGGSALDGAEMLWLNSRLTADRDVILIDQRGTGYSQPSLNCTEFDQDSLIRQNDNQLMIKCRNRLESTGINLASYNSAQNAADIAMLRTALGITQADLLGVSYGTRLALTVIRDHPEGFRSIILDSVYPPQADGISEQPLVSLQAIEALTNGCQQDAACRQAFPNLFNRLTEVVTRLNQDPVSVKITDPYTGERSTEQINGDDVVYTLGSELYSTAVIPYLPAYINALYEEKYDRAYEILDTAYANMPEPEGNFPEPVLDVSDSEGMFTSVECYDEVAFSSVSAATSLVQGYPSTYTDQMIWDTEDFFDTCQMWMDASAPPIEDQPVRSNIPVLILNGDYDPVTPPAWAQAAADYLPNSQVFIFPGHGHAVIDAGTCPVTLMLDFLENPDQTVNNTCFAAISPPDFVINP
ncbi:MAG: alpha/beta hydrolase [Anaerolineales bacterium]